MLSKNTIKRITRLSQKKYRISEGLFVAEGLKVISELLNSDYSLEVLYTIDSEFFPNRKSEIVTYQELKKISFLTTPQKALALFHIPQEKKVRESGLCLALDKIRDPGNLGTIIRLCDWFGVENIICSNDTVDCFNPKVVQATMGSLSRVRVHYLDLVDYIKNTSLPCYATTLEGHSIYKTELQENAILIMGNEANGISKEILEVIDNKLTIPRFGNTKETESLNVAMATSICLSEFRRR